MSDLQNFEHRWPALWRKRREVESLEAQLAVARHERAVLEEELADLYWTVLAAGEESAGAVVASGEFA